MKRVLVSGYIGFNNFGDEAIFYALKNHLKSLGCFVSVLSNNKNDIKKRYGIKAYNYKNLLQILKAIINCDVLISGGGSLLQNKTSNFSLFYYLFIIFLAKIFFKKVIIFAQGIEPIEGKIQIFITKTILKFVDFVSVRDEKSANLLNKWKISSVVLSDPFYSLVENMEICKNKNGLIIQLRKTFKDSKKLLDDLSEFIKKFYQGKITVLSLHKELDEEICQNFVQKLENLGIKAEYIDFYDIEKIITLLNEAKYVISTRLHGLIAASALKTKCFALSYDEKIKTLCDDRNIPYIDIYDYKQSDFEKKIDEFFNNKINEVHPYRPFRWECIDNILKK